MKRINNVILTIITCMAIMSLALIFVMSHSTTIQADDTVHYDGKDYQIYTSGDYNYILVNKEIVIISYSGTDAYVTLPSEIKGYPVTVINDGAFRGNNSMQVLTIPSPVKKIGNNAFRDCSALQQVLVGNGVKVVGEYAFYNCTYMSRIQFNGNVLESIEKCAFEHCVALEQFKLPDSLTYIGEYAFNNCKLLDNIVFPSTLKTIGNCAFKSCSSLSYIELPDSVTSLGGSVFAGCESLKKAVIGNGVTEILSSGAHDFGGSDGWRDGAFESCTNLSEVIIGDGVKTIDTDAFANTNLKSVDIPDNVKKIGDGAFINCGSLETVSIGKNVRYIGNRVFYKNTSLKEIEIPGSVTYLGGSAFAGCTSLEKAVIGNGVTEILSSGAHDFGGSDGWRDGAFESCTNLSEVIIGDGVKTIDTDAFANTNLKSVDIPDNVVNIKNGAFYKCISLNDINIGRGVVSIGSMALYGCDSLKELFIPSSVTSLGSSLCSGSDSLEKVVIGNGVTEILSSGVHDFGGSDGWRDGAFEACPMLSYVSLGSGLTKIDVDSFADTAITTILIPNKVSSLGNGTFYNTPINNIYFTGNAPAFGRDLFGKSLIPGLYKMKSKTGYDNVEYIFNDFEPVKVIFDLNNSDVFAIQPSDQYLSPEGGYVIEPISPVAEGYVFGGWYEDSDCTLKWNFMKNKVVSNTTIYAKWDKLEEVAPVRPENLELISSTYNSITLSWDKTLGATGYLIYVDNSLVNSDAISDTRYVITGLDSDTSYEINVVALNEAGQSEKSLTKVAATDEFNGYELGDVNGDTLINASDALTVLKHAAKLSELNDIEQVAANVTKDETINATDALQILKYAAKLIDSF